MGGCGSGAKLPLLAHADKTCRALDSAISKVSVSWSDSDKRILVVTSCGQAQADRQPMGQISVSVSAEKNGEVQSGQASLSLRQEIRFLHRRAHQGCLPQGYRQRHDPV